MEPCDKSARRLLAELKAGVKANPVRRCFGRKPAIGNGDPQKAYISVGEFVTAYETDPKRWTTSMKWRT